MVSIFQAEAHGKRGHHAKQDGRRCKQGHSGGDGDGVQAARALKKFEHPGFGQADGGGGPGGEEDDPAEEPGLRIAVRQDSAPPGAEAEAGEDDADETGPDDQGGAEEGGKNAGAGQFDDHQGRAAEKNAAMEHGRILAWGRNRSSARLPFPENEALWAEVPENGQFIQEKESLIPWQQEVSHRR